MAGKKSTVDIPPMPSVECGYIGCKTPALIRLRRTNVCHDHYVAMISLEAKKHAERTGLKAVDDHRAYCRSLMDKFGNVDKREWMKNPKSEIARRFAAEFLKEQQSSLKEEQAYPKEERSNPKRERIPGEDDEMELAA